MNSESDCRKLYSNIEYIWSWIYVTLLWFSVLSVLSPVQRVYLWASIVQTMVNLGGLYSRRDDCFLLCCEFWMRLENYVLQYWTFILVFWSCLCRGNFDILSSVFYHLLTWYIRQILQNCQSHWRDVLEFSQDPNIGAVVKALPHVIKCAKSDTRNQNNRCVQKRKHDHHSRNWKSIVSNYLVEQIYFFIAFERCFRWLFIYSYKFHGILRCLNIPYNKSNISCTLEQGKFCYPRGATLALTVKYSLHSFRSGVPLLLLTIMFLIEFLNILAVGQLIKQRMDKLKIVFRKSFVSSLK